MDLMAMKDALNARAATGAAMTMHATVAQLFREGGDWPISGDQLACRLAGVR